MAGKSKSAALLLAAGALLGQIPPQLLQRRALKAPYQAYLVLRSCLIPSICLTNLWTPRPMVYDVALGVLLGQDALLTWLLLFGGRPICGLLKQLGNSRLWAWWALLGARVGASLLSCTWSNLMWCWMFLRFHAALGALWALLRVLLRQVRRLNSSLGGAQDLQALMALQLRFFTTIAQVNRVFGLALFGFIALNVVLLIATLSMLGLLDLSQMRPQQIFLDLFNIASFQLHVAAVILAADQLQTEIARTISFSYKQAWLEQLGARRANLIKLAEQTHLMRLPIKAAGILDVDNSTFVFIASTVCTYVTVVFQMKVQ